MADYAFITVDVFTDRRFGGNPLAVFPDAAGLPDATMQALAAELNLSETTFVLPPEDPAHAARVRIFTPRAELPFAGHPNVGTGVVLAQQGRDRDGVLVFEETAGLVEVRIDRTPAGAVTGATIAAPQPLSFGPLLSAASIAACAGISANDVIETAHAPVTASLGTPFVIAEVHPAALRHASPDLAAFRRTIAEQPALNGHLLLHLYAHEGTYLRARVFAPLLGIPEDPATGSANATLAALLLSLRQETRVEYEIRQGDEMGRPSLLFATARRSADGIRASVGGGCVLVLRGTAEA